MTMATEIVTVKYDEESRHWSPDPNVNLLFVQTIFNYMSDMLKSQGYVMLNEMLYQLGLPRTTQGQLVGWVYSENETWWKFLTSSENDDIVLTFYTHGEVYDKIDEIEKAK